MAKIHRHKVPFMQVVTALKNKSILSSPGAKGMSYIVFLMQDILCKECCIMIAKFISSNFIR